MITLGFCNLKGGVGKTTACQNIAAAIARTGRKIAVVDMDPQSNLSAGFGVTPSPSEPQVFDLLSGDASWDDIVRHKEGVDIIPSSLNLVMAELNNTGLFASDMLLRDALKKISPDRYDYIILDSPPQLGIFTRNVLAACNKVIVPMDGGFYSLFGLKLLESSLSVLSERLENNLEILGILMTNYNPRLYIAKNIFDEVKKTFGDVLFESYISQSVGLIEASSMGLSIFEYSPKSKAAECYRDVAKELVRRVEGENSQFEEVSKKKTRKKKEKQEQKGTQEIQKSANVQEPQEAKAEEPVKNPEEHEPEQKPEKISEPEIKTEPKPEQKQVPVAQPFVQILTGDPYVDGIKQQLLDLLPERQKQQWAHVLAPISDISRGEIDVRELRDDFENSDKYRYTFYILNDEEDKLFPVAFADQIIEPLRCVVKLDENGSAEIFF